MPQKDTNDIMRLFNKCNEQNYRPSYYEKLEAEVEYIRTLNEECSDANGKLMTFNELKGLCEKLTPYKPVAEFKTLQDRLNKATILKTAITSFLKAQSFKTRGGNQDERLDIKKATDILETAEKLKITFDNLDKFKEKLKEMVDLISEIDIYLASDNNFKSMESANKYLDILLNTGLEASQILKLNQVKDYLEQLEVVDKNIRFLEVAEENKRILEHLFRVGFVTMLGENLMDECNAQIKWKRSIQHFQSIPETFTVELFMEGRLPSLLDIGQFNEMSKVPHSITVAAEIKNFLDAKKAGYLAAKRPPPAAPIKDKLKVAREIYLSKIVDADKAAFLKSLQEELRFTMEVASIMTALNQPQTPNPKPQTPTPKPHSSGVKTELTTLSLISSGLFKIRQDSYQRCSELTLPCRDGQENTPENTPSPKTLL